MPGAQTFRNRSLLMVVVSVSLVATACAGGEPSPSPTGATTQPESPTPAGPTDPVGEPEKTSLSLGIRTGNIGSVAPLYIAKDKGYYAEEGLEVEVIITDQVQEGLVGGSLDLGVFDPDAAAESINQGVPIVMVAGNRQREPLIIGAGAGISGPEDLNGKDVALGLGPGDPATNFRLDALKAEGWDLSTLDVQYVSPPGGSDARVELLIGGQIALTYMFPRHPPAVQEAGGIIIINDYLDPFLNDVFIATESWVSSNPNALTRFIRATIRGKQIFNDLSNKDEVLQIMANNGFEVGDREREQYEFDPPQHDIDMAIPKEGYDRLMAASGVDDPGYDNVTNLEYLHAAQEALGLPMR